MTAGAITPYMFDTHAVRIADADGEPWFVLADVCAALEISNPSDAASRLDDDEKGVVTADTPGGAQEMRTISESGVYSLIFRSRKASARRFKKWVTADVLPTIRRTGSYGTPSIPAALDNNATLRALLLGKLDRLDVVQPKADAFDRLADARGALSITEAAKALKVGRDALFKWMNENGWIYRAQASGRWMAYRDKETTGRLEHRVSRLPSLNGGPDRVVTTVMVTPKGLARLAELVPGAHPHSQRNG